MLKSLLALLSVVEVFSEGCDDNCCSDGGRYWHDDEASEHKGLKDHIDCCNACAKDEHCTDSAWNADKKHCYFYEHPATWHWTWDKKYQTCHPNPPAPPPTPGPTPSPPPPPGPHGDTRTTRALNAAIKASNYPDVYKAGKGILVRNPFDGFEDDTNKKVVPATFWVNDIFSPSQLYAGYGGGDGNPWCPTHMTNCPADSDTGDTGPFNSIQMGYVINTHMDKFFSDFGNVQKTTWGNGVFYATDANAADLRCAYFDDYKGYDCPGGWIDAASGSWSANSDKKGAGFYRGAGCHFNHVNGIDQTNAETSSGVNLVGSYECECEYSFKQDWSKWVDQWMQLGGTGKGASWQADLAACWVNNPRDMINLQNQFYWKRKEWNNQQVPQVGYKDHDAKANRAYWGWNEVPVDRVSISNQGNWDAVMIKLPAAVCGGNGDDDLLSCVPHQYQVQLEKQLNMWNKYGKLNHEIVMVKESMDGSTNYQHTFFCQAWTSPSSHWTIKYEGDKCTIVSSSAVVV